MLKIIVNILIAGIAGQFGLAQSESNQGMEPFGPAVLGVQEIISPVRVNIDNQGLKLSAKGAIVIDRDSGRVLFEKNPDSRLPVASISKLATALVFLETDTDWDKVVFMESGDYVGGARLKVGLGEGLTVKDLFYASLVGSANNGVAALVRATDMSNKEFIIKMNKKAQELGMEKTYFAEPTGLNMVNHSTARDVAKLMEAVLGKEEIVKALNMEKYGFKTLNTNRWVSIQNTDKLLSSFLNNGDGYKVLGGKTGYNLEARHCLTAGIRGQQKQEIVAVILGAESNSARFQEMKGLAWWVFSNWKWERDNF